MSDLSVCYFGAYRPNYPRNLTIRRALALAQIPVVECRVSPKWPTWRRWPFLLWQFLTNKQARSSSIIFLAEFSHTVAPLAWALSRLTGAAFIFDPGISNYDEMIVCQQQALPTSWRAKYLRWTDALAFKLADLVLWFTPVDEEYFAQQYKIPTVRSAWLPPGVDETSFVFTPLPTREGVFVVHWDGSFIASHGVEVILDAAYLLREQKDIFFELVGEGPLYTSMHQYADKLELGNVRFLGKVPFEELVASVKRSHVCLGTFRNDDKQRRSLYTKELQSMLVGRPLITSEGEAKQRVFDPQKDLWLIGPQNPPALAEAILALYYDPLRAQQLATHGHLAVANLCPSVAISQRLQSVLQKALSQRCLPSML